MEATTFKDNNKEEGGFKSGCPVREKKVERIIPPKKEDEKSSL